MGRLSLAAPIPPLALRRGQQWIARLGHRRAKHVEDARVLPLPCQPAKPIIHFARVGTRKLANVSNAQHFEIAEHGRSHGNQIA
jgi:hypothetical protein